MKTLSITNVMPIPVRISNGNGTTNGSMPFLVKISERTNFPIEQLEKLLNSAVSRLSQAPYYSYIKGRTINILVVSQEELGEVGVFQKGRTGSIFTPPEIRLPQHFAGVYDPTLNAVLINATKASREAFDQEVMIHELLHAYSTQEREIDERSIEIRTGLAVSVTEKNIRKVSFEPKGYFLNEGLTEFLRIQTSIEAKRYRNESFPIQEAVALLIQSLGQEIFLDAYFNGNIQRLEKAMAELHGPEAYCELGKLALFVGHVGDERASKSIKWFALYGFEHDIMNMWNYSPENRSRAPRQISLNRLPSTLKSVLRKGGIEVYTNLTEEELNSFSLNFSLPEKHDPPLPENFLQDPKKIENLFLSQIEERRGKKCYLCIRFGIGEKGHKAWVATEWIDKRYLTFPHFLGRENPISTFLGVSL